MASSCDPAGEFGDDFHDYYAILGVAWDAGIEEVERAYRKLVISSHPDRFLHDSSARCAAETKLRRVNAVMRVLRDDTLRCHYDERFRREKPLTVRLVRGGSRDT